MNLLFSQCCFHFQAKDLPTYKDNDFMTDGIKINIGQEAKEKLLQNLTKDVEVNILHTNLTYCFYIN